MAELKIGTKVKDRYTLKEFKGVAASEKSGWHMTKSLTAMLP